MRAAQSVERPVAQHGSRTSRPAPADHPDGTREESRQEGSMTTLLPKLWSQRANNRLCRLEDDKAKLPLLDLRSGRASTAIVISFPSCMR